MFLAKVRCHLVWEVLLDPPLSQQVFPHTPDGLASLLPAPPPPTVCDPLSNISITGLALEMQNPGPPSLTESESDFHKMCR